MKTPAIVAGLVLFTAIASLGIAYHRTSHASAFPACDAQAIAKAGRGDEPGENIAGLYSLVQSCEANGIDPRSYLADVLVRVKQHPQARIDELLPHLWRTSAPNTS
jgi:hypothetical protein